MKEKRFYVYAHYCNNKLMYIGKGTKKRYLSLDNRNKHWNNTVNKYGDLKCYIISDIIDETDAYELEEFIIDEIGLDNLTNVSRGGIQIGGYDVSGDNNPMYGKVHPNKGKKMPQNGHQGRVGKKHTQDSIDRNMMNQESRVEVVIDGVTYPSITNASKSTGICRSTIARRLKKGVALNKRSGTSNYKGVSSKVLESGGLKWIAQIQINKNKVNLGRFDSELEAHEAYQKALMEVNMLKFC